LVKEHSKRSEGRSNDPKLVFAAIHIKPEGHRTLAPETPEYASILCRKSFRLDRQSAGGSHQLVLVGLTATDTEVADTY
jgi:hypothetical protein